MKFNITFLPSLLLKSKESKNSVKKGESQQKRGKERKWGKKWKTWFIMIIFNTC